jgi:hypothetical protein
MINNRIIKPRCPSSVLPDDWIIFSQIWFETCRHFGLAISHHVLAVAMHKADEGKQPWEVYLTRCIVECQRQWDLEDVKVQANKAHHERRGVVFLPIETGWEIRVYDSYVWTYQSVKTWLADYDAQTAWFYEADAHLRPAQRRAEILASVA